MQDYEKHLSLAIIHTEAARMELKKLAAQNPVLAEKLKNVAEAADFLILARHGDRKPEE